MIIGEASEAARVEKMLDELLVAVREGHTPTLSDLSYVLSETLENNTDGLGKILGSRHDLVPGSLQVKPRTRGQARYLDAMRRHDVTLAIGPAGTGKTFLAMVVAVGALLNKEVDRLILTRPAVEAGENLGFLPGDLRQKVNPYLRPLFDALYILLDAERVHRMLERELIEVAPLAFMRGRTFTHSFVVLDEAQNTTHEQMKMFLTRLGEGSRAVITGDITQIDLPAGQHSGMVEARRILRNTEGVAVVHLNKGDVVRHRLVQNIIAAYERDEKERMKARETHTSSPESEKT